MKKLFVVASIFICSFSIAYAQFDDSTSIDDAISQENPTQAQQDAANLPGVNQPLQTSDTSVSQTGGATGGSSGFVPLTDIPGLTRGATANTAGLAAFLNNLYKFLIGIAAVLAVIMIIWGGLEISTQDSVTKNKDGKERIKWAIFGLVLVLSPVLVFSIINPAILNLSINLPKLDTASGPSRSSATSPTTLSNTDLQLRQQWGQIYDTFTVNSNLSVRDRIAALDAKQVECTRLSSGTGVILPNNPMGGGNIQYVCQSCPTNTTPILYNPGTVNDNGARGTCTQNQASRQQPTTSGEGYYSSPQSGMTCLAPKDTSNGAYYCAKDSGSCSIVLNTFGSGNVTSGCTAY